MIKSSNIFDLIIGSVVILLHGVQMTEVSSVENSSRQKHPNLPRFPHFTDFSRQAGVDHAGKSVGAIWLDYNNDGWLDFDNDGNFELCVENRYSSQIFRKTDQDTFVNITDSFGFLSRFSDSQGLAWADFNNDGLLDVYICRSDGNIAREGSPPNQLFKNLGNGQFKEMAGQAGVGDSYDANWIDFDNDGFTDLCLHLLTTINNYPSKPGLYRNNGNETFTDITHDVGLDTLTMAYISIWADYDNHGDLDFYVTNNRGGYDDYPIKDKWPNRLDRNNGNGTFTDVAAHSGVRDESNSKGCCFGDYDNDGDLDLYVGNDGSPNKLHQNNGDGTFTDVTERAGVTEPIGTAGVVFADFDSDGWLDIYAAGASYIPEQHDYCMHKDHPDLLYHNNGDGTFADITQSSGININNPSTYGLTVGDYENDGDLDVFLANSLYHGSYVSASVLIKNNDNNNHWLYLKLVGRNSNRSAIGARAKVVAGDLAQIREVEGGHGRGSQNSLLVEFGLGRKEPVDEMIIRWLSKLIQKLKKVPIDRLLIVDDPYQLGRLHFSAATFRFIIFGFLVLIGIALFTIFFIILAIPAIKKYQLASQRKSVLRAIRSQTVPAPVAKSMNTESQKDEVLSVNVNLVQFRDEHLVIYSITSNFPTSNTLRAFAEVAKEKIPYPIKDIKIQRLQQKIEQLWQSYAQHVVNGQQSATRPLALSQDIGEKIYYYFGLTGPFKTLFSLTEVHVNFIIDCAIIPWH